MPWISANDLECDCGPTTRRCGTEEYPLPSDHKIKNRNRQGPGVKKPLPEEKLRQLYIDDKLSDNKIARFSELHFGFKCTHTHVWRERKKYGIESRGKGHSPSLFYLGQK